MREWLKRLVSATLYGHNGECNVGSAYPRRHKDNCDNPAVIRFRVEGHEWHYVCNEHGGWPMWDRSKWLQDFYEVERWAGDSWESWEDFNINTPESERDFDDDGEWIIKSR